MAVLHQVPGHRKAHHTGPDHADRSGIGQEQRNRLGLGAALDHEELFDGVVDRFIAEAEDLRQLRSRPGDPRQVLQLDQVHRRLARHEDEGAALIKIEAWDAAGLYQVGSFSDNRRWQEWNGRFRDDVRLFMSGGRDAVHRLATRIAGSSDLYQANNRGPLNSVNFITCHDGFTLYDLVSYNDKRNLENGEQNRDGENHNLSWNSGFEGSPADADIERFRRRRIKSIIALLMSSQGIPMLWAGDELGRSQGGNNNGWCQDNETSWMNWQIDETAADLLRFFRKCIGLRRSFALFRRAEFFPDEDENTPPESREITWQSLQPGSQDWSSDCHHLGILLNGECGHSSPSTHFFIMVNGSRHDHQTFTVPQPPSPGKDLFWVRIIDTSLESPDDFIDAAEADLVAPGTGCRVEPMGLVLLQSRQKPADPPTCRSEP